MQPRVWHISLLRQLRYYYIHVPNHKKTQVKRQLQMELEDPLDPLDLASIAIRRVAHTATLLGVKHKNVICARLGAELLIVAGCLITADSSQKEQLRWRIPKLMNTVEQICRVSAGYAQPRLHG